MKFNLKDFRQSQGMYQSELAELLGMNQSNVSRAELRGGFDLSYQQKQILYDKYGKEAVDSFFIEEPEPISISTCNTNEGNGTQNNTQNNINNGGPAMEIIRIQATALSELASKQSQQADRLIALLEKLSDKI